MEAAIGSVLPLCKHFVVAVGAGEDDTRERVASIDTSAMDGGRGGEIEILDTVWPDVRVDGEVLSIEANKAMALAEERAKDFGSPWGFYIQADEVVHEDDLDTLSASMARFAGDDYVKALVFFYHHFVLDYRTEDPWMYHKASRVVRLDGSCEIVGDACGPAIKGYAGKVRGGNGYLDKHHLGGHARYANRSGARWQVAWDRPARVFHYGWVKTKEELEAKFGMVDKLWWGTLTEEERSKRRGNKFGQFIERYPALRKYRKPHPGLMAERVAAHPEFARVASRWVQPKFWRESFAHGLKWF
ncbi:MAG: hypothetical protein AAF612_09095 [Planctomycetota bacterium]